MAQQGHWRRLKPGQVGEGRFGERTPGKTWVDRKETAATQKAKTKGAVPLPQLVTVKDGFAIFAVPGGRYLFIVHTSVAKKFADLSNSKNWTDSPDLRKFMGENEKTGKFGIMQTEKPVLEY